MCAAEINKKTKFYTKTKKHIIKYSFTTNNKPQQQQEQDPTNLYIANLPANFKETDLEAMLSKYGQVVSTRILRDAQMNSKGKFSKKKLKLN